MKTILYASEIAGTQGGIEEYVRNTADVLRAGGWRVELLYAREGRGAEEYLAHFDAASTDPAALTPAPDLAIAHRIWDGELFERFLVRHGSRAALVVHDHHLYCPRHHYYTPFGRRNCQRAWSYLRCTLCAACRRHPDFRELCLDFPRRYRLAHFAPRLIVLSEFMRANLVRNGFAQERIAVVPPVVEVPQECTAPDPARFKGGRPRIGFLGQLIRGKGADTFLEVLDHLRQRGRAFDAVLAGAGEDFERLQATAARLRLPVEMPGFVSPARQIYERCDLMLFPFRWQEPFGLTGAEAAAHAVPVVAFDRGGVRQWLRDGETGFAVPPEAGVAGLAAAVEKLLDAPALCARTGLSARAFAARSWNPSRFVAAIDTLSKGD